MANVKFTFDWTLQGDNDKEVTYEVDASCFPGDPGKLSGPPERCYPPEDPEVQSVEVYWRQDKQCDTCKGIGKLDNWTKRCGVCHGTGRVKLWGDKNRERRAELDELVDEDEVLEQMNKHLDDGPDEPDCDRDD